MMGFKHARYLCFGLGLTLSAAAPAIDLGLKMGAGFNATEAAQHSNLSLHVGLTGSYKLSEKSSIIGELTYRYFRADDWERPLPAFAYAPDGTATYAPTPMESIDTRQNPLEGLGLHLGYRRAIGASNWSWQAGVNLHYMKSTDQAIGDVSWSAPYSTNPATWNHEGFSKLNSTSSIKPGVFVGLHSFLNEDVFVEVNALTVGYSQITYVPMVYTGKPAHTETADKNKLVLEMSMGFRF